MTKEQELGKQGKTEIKNQNCEGTSKLPPKNIVHIIEKLKDGNRRFMNGTILHRDVESDLKIAAKGQKPEAIVLACIDSRVPVAQIFDQGIGDLFVLRVAGNIINEDILGSMEFACEKMGTQLILVLGHEDCGAVQAAIEGNHQGNLNTLLKKISPAVEQARNFDGVQSAENPDYVQKVCCNNVHQSMKEILNGSSVLKKMVADYEIVIQGAVYHTFKGEVEFF